MTSRSTSSKQDKVSDPTDTIGTEAELDTLLQKAAVPNLSSLFRQAKDAGLIQPITAYGAPVT